MNEPIQEAVLIERKLFEQVVEGLKKIAVDVFCDGPGCIRCEDGGPHCFTDGALIAQRLLTQLTEHRKEGV